ncbi:MAG: CDP-alcohol phosphatidyltransferase family protein [Brucellaceae bacterium]|nr:CDP-alcohol phosphatidyltransferase family protein [Brucellaceae bacterium]
MLDGVLKKQIEPVLDVIGAALAARGVTANAVTYAGLGIGLGAAAAIAVGAYRTGLVLLLVSRLADGLDGAVARATHKTDFGGYIDIVLDFLFYGAIPAAFVVADPATNGIAGAALLLSFYFNGATFLAYSTLAERHGLETTQRGEKSIYFTTGLAEATETLAVFVLFCLFPAWFPALAFAFAAVCFYTAVSRIVLARSDFR